MSEELLFWYYCKDCKTRWEAKTGCGYSLDGYSCSYCDSLNTKFIGWVEE